MNFSSGTISFWDRYADGTYNYHRFGNFGSGTKNPDFALGRRADAFVYDPNGNCSRLYLRNFVEGGIAEQVEVVKVDLGGAAASRSL
jgi:hypothetical protein